jgi:hypothetical protein
LEARFWTGKRAVSGCDIWNSPESCFAGKKKTLMLWKGPEVLGISKLSAKVEPNSVWETLRETSRNGPRGKKCLDTIGHHFNIPNHHQLEDISIHILEFMHIPLSITRPNLPDSKKSPPGFTDCALCLPWVLTSWTTHPGSYGHWHYSVSKH